MSNLRTEAIRLQIVHSATVDDEIDEITMHLAPAARWQPIWQTLKRHQGRGVPIPPSRLPHGAFFRTPRYDIEITPWDHTVLLRDRHRQPKPRVWKVSFPIIVKEMEDDNGQ